MTALLLILFCLAALVLTVFLCLRAYGWEIRAFSLLREMENADSESTTKSHRIEP